MASRRSEAPFLATTQEVACPTLTGIRNTGRAVGVEAEQPRLTILTRLDNRRTREVSWRRRVSMLTASSTGWQVGIALGVVVIAVAAAIVIMIVLLAARIAKQAKTAEHAVEVVRQQTAELGGIAQINDSGVRILHAARALRKVAVGK